MTLPKFLTAWSDFNWLWLYAKLRPATDAHWSITRTLALTLLAGGLAAFAGLFIALAAYRQPVGWLAWLLGLWWGCIGLCWFGVTGICWNQRVAALRAAPALPATLPRSRFRFGRWCLGLIYIVILGIITPLALVVTVENIRGEIAWKREHARLIAAGEKLTFREILGPEIPPEQNAGAAAIFAPFFDYRIEGALEWLSSNTIAPYGEAFRLPSEKHVTNSKGVVGTPEVNLADWSAAYRSMIAKPRTDDPSWAKELKLPEVGNNARDVLAGTERMVPALQEICAAAALPRSQFPLHHHEGFDTLLAHLARLKVTQQILELRCAAHLALDTTAAAFADATNTLNVAELLREEPILVSQLVRYSQWAIAISTLWQGLAEHRWSDAQLEFFQRRLERVDCPQGLVLAFEGERAIGILCMERLIDNPPIYDDAMGPGTGSMIQLLRTLPRSVLRRSQMTLAHYQSVALSALRAELTNAPQTGLAAIVQSRDSKLEHIIPGDFSPYTVMVRQLALATGGAIRKTARAQTTVKLAIVACALERHRLAHGSYPETLDALAPLFAAGVPLDPMVNKPFHYQRTDDGWFLLYSVGINGTDDGGVMSSGDKNKNEKEINDWPWPVPTRPAKTRLF